MTDPKTTPDNRSPYCMRCNRKDHGMYEGGFHETNEHDEWLERQRLKERFDRIVAEPTEPQ